MATPDRYDVAGLDEAQWEPGAEGRVLRNLLHVTSTREMDEIEGREQVRVLEALAATYDRDHRFTAEDVCRIHRMWLGGIYAWAGQYRQVNLQKEGFPFAAAAQIPRLMAELEHGALRTCTPCRPGPVAQVAASLALVHVELVLVHPFREGNGRVARLLAVLMGLQADLPPLYFENLGGRRRQAYLAAIRAGMDRDYEPMAAIFSAVIQKTLEICPAP